MAGSRSRTELFASVMAGGKGTRFWPLSREKFPKQYLKLVGERTLLQDTLHRLAGFVRPENIHVITTSSQRDIVDWQVREMHEMAPAAKNTVVEPMGRNTAAAIALMAFKLHKKNRNAVALVLPADHFVGDNDDFVRTLASAVPQAEAGSIVTFGIKPTRPETGYGYIKSGKKIAKGVHHVSRFVEKPDAETARKYLEQGGYYWNSGMFMFRASRMIDEIKAHMPALYKALHSIKPALNTAKEDAALERIYEGLADVSIDYGVMEKTRSVVMVAAEFMWSDIGSWSSLGDVIEADAHGNVIEGNALTLGCSDSILFSTGKLVAGIGLKDMVVVDTSDATLIAPKDRVQEVKDLVGAIKREGKEEYLEPRVEERPWGYFSVLESGSNYKIKHIYLKPGAKLSLQMHNHRSEHWIVVAGTAMVTRGEEELYVHQNESTFIPATMKHRLANPGLIPLRMIEIQSGEYLGEDDIIRFDDSYGRKTK